MLVPILAAVFIVFMLVLMFRRFVWNEEQQALWKALTEELRLQPQGEALLGEYGEVPLRIFMAGGQEAEDPVRNFMIRAEVPGKLPRGFVAASRSKAGWLSRALADNLVASSHPELEEWFVFQSDRPQECKALIEEPSVQEALLRLHGPGRIGFVEKNRVLIMYNSLPKDVAEAEQAMRDAGHAALTLAAAQAELGALEPEPE